MQLLKVALLAASLLPCSMAVADDQPAVQAETLMRSTSSWDGVPYKAYPGGQPELSVVKVTIPPHTQMKWHTHPIPNAAYVLSGELTVEKKDGGEKRILTAGQVLPETVDTLHRGVAGDQPVVLIVFYAGAKGIPLSQISQTQ